MEEMTMEVAVELLKAVVESSGDAAEITEAVAVIMKVAMEITQTVMDITEAEMEITEAEGEVLKVVVEVSEITRTNMKGNIRMDCHEEVDSQEGKVIKTLRLVSFVIMTVFAELSGWAWAALKYTS